MEIEYLKQELGKIGDHEIRADAGFTNILDKELEHVTSRVLETKYPGLIARQAIPVSNEADPAAETISYDMYDDVGMAQLISNYADDFPLVDSLRQRFTCTVKGIGAHYQWSILDLRRAALARQPLDVRRARAARRIMERQLDKIACLGLATAGINGFAKHPNVSTVAPDTGTWSTASGIEILEDMTKGMRTVDDTTKGAFFANALAMPVEEYNLVRRKLISTTGDTGRTVLQAFLEIYPGTAVLPWNRLENANATDNGPRLVFYTRDPEVLTLEIPQEYEEVPPQAKGLAFKVYCHMRTGGVKVHYPIAMRYMDGV